MHKTFTITKEADGWSLNINNGRSTVTVATFPNHMMASSLMALCAKAVLRDYFIDEIVVDADNDGWVFLHNMGVISPEMWETYQKVA